MVHSLVFSSERSHEFTAEASYLWVMLALRWQSMKSVEHDWNQSVRNNFSHCWPPIQFVMTEISGAWLKSVDHDWSQWFFSHAPLISVHWFQSCSTDFSHASLISVMLHWFQSCFTDFSHASLISVMLHWFQSCFTDFSHASLISVMLHWFQSCSTDFSHASLISVMLHFSHAPLISVKSTEAFLTDFMTPTEVIQWLKS